MAPRKPKDPKELTKYGHWNVEICGEFDTHNYVAFVYAVHLKNGQKYIGVKKFWQRIAKPPCEFKRGPKKKLTEHKWRSYNTSSSILKEIPEEDIENRYILGCYSKWGTALMAEFMFQYHCDAMRSEQFLNFQMGGHFSKSTYPEDDIYEKIEKYKETFMIDENNKKTYILNS